MSHRVLSAFKLVYGHLNSIFLTSNFAWGQSIYFANRGQKDGAKFLYFDPCTVCGKTLRDSGGVYLPAFWATLPYYLLFGPHPNITVIKSQCLRLSYFCQNPTNSRLFSSSPFEFYLLCGSLCQKLCQFLLKFHQHLKNDRAPSKFK